MSEDIGKIIGKGFETYKNNLNLGIPFLLDTIITGLLAIVMIITGVLYIFGSSLPSLENASPEQAMLIIFSLIKKHLVEIIILIIIYLLISLFISSFFTAGAIGMAKQAIESGRSEISSMIHEGKKNVVNLYLAEILVGLLFLSGIVFLVPGAMKININNLLSPNIDVLLLIAGVLIWVMYIIILSVVLAIYRYALVVNHLAPIDGILAGIGFFRRHKLNVFILWLLTGALVVMLALVGQLMGFIPVLNIAWPFVSILITTLVISPLTTVWWVCLLIKNQ